MSEVRNKYRRKKRGKSKNKEFMDAALDAFIRDQSLQKWHEVDGLRTGAEIDASQAVKSSSEFMVKGPYREIWRRWWQQEVIDKEQGTIETLFAQIEKWCPFSGWSVVPGRWFYGWPNHPAMESIMYRGVELSRYIFFLHIN